MKIVVAKDYTKTPGGRYYSDGLYSGERFREEILKPKFVEAITKGEILVVDLDGGYGYGTSFLEEAFGGLARELKDSRIADIQVVSNEEPMLISQIKSYISKGLRRK